jgi:hypothetical protein
VAAFTLVYSVLFLDRRRRIIVARMELKTAVTDAAAFAELLPVIRERLQARVYQTSLRATAREVGMSSTGLSDLIERGRTPYGKTVQKLLEWYAANGADAAPDPRARDVGVELLTRTITPRALRDGVARVIRRLSEEPDAAVLARVQAALDAPAGERKS